MTCACSTDNDEVTAACGAHMNWLRRVERKDLSKDLEQAKKDLDYQTKRANTFEKLLIGSR